LKDTKSGRSGNAFDFLMIKRLFRFIRPYKGQFYLVVLLTILSAVLGPVKPWVIKKTIDEYIATSDKVGLLNMTVFLLLLLVVHGLVQYFHTFLSGLLGQNVIKDVRINLYQHVSKFRLKFFDKTPIGRLVTRNVSDVGQLSEVFSEGVANIVSDCLQILVIIGFMLYTDWKLTLISLSILPLLLICTYIFKEKVKFSFNLVRNAVANLNTFVQEHISGMTIVQIFTAEEREYKKFKAINEEHKKANLLSVMYYAVYFPVTEMIAAMGTALLVWFGAKGIISEVFTVGDFILFTMLSAMLFRPIRMIADRFNTLQMGIVSAQRIFNLIDLKDELETGGTYKPDLVKGDITYENVWFSYNDHDFILKDLSFSVKQGETIAFVGATGAGKTSVINLLNRFYEFQKGRILLDGVDIRDYDLGVLRSNMAVVLQDVFLFSDTIRNNITLNNDDITEEKILETAEMVGARSFIENLPGKFEYNVQERGATLSVGQRQLISFIRALVYDPKIIVMDEATSSVDNETEEMIEKAIDKLMKGRTCFIIAHRLSTIQKANKIVVLDKGQVVEMGSHEELLEKGGNYARLYNIQFAKEVKPN
jgi:ATP-binding cassette subfamily B multidrug efflux pump